MKTQTNLIITKLLTNAAKRRASDIHLNVGNHPMYRIDQKLVELSEEPIIQNDFIKDLLDVVLNDEQKKQLSEKKIAKSVYCIENDIRFRVNVHYQRGNISISLKLINTKIPTIQDLRLGANFQKMATIEDGLIVMSGPYNSGKTTLMVSLLEEINRTRSLSIVTFEDPVEYIFVNGKSIVEQRQVGRDVNSFVEGIRQCHDEDVDVVAVMGSDDEKSFYPELLKLAGSGKLVVHLMDTISVIQSIEVLLAAYGSGEVKRAQSVLADTLQAVVTMRLMPKSSGGGRALAYGMLITNGSVKSLIRDGKISQLVTTMQTSQEEGMITLDQQLYMLVQQGIITPETGIRESVDKNEFEAKLHQA